MNIRTIFSAFFYCLLFACNPKPDLSANQSATAKIEKSILQENYSDSTYSAINGIVKKTGLTDIHVKLIYYYYCSEYYRRKQNTETAKQYAERMLSIVNEPNYKGKLIKEVALANIAKADAFYAMKQYKDCYYYYCLGSIEAYKLQDPVVTKEINNHLSTFLYEEGNYLKAIFYYKQLLKKFDSANKTYERLTANQGALDNIGLCFLKAAMPDSAIYYFSEACNNLKQAALLPSYPYDFCQIALGVVLGNMAQAYQMKGNNEMAETLYKQSIAINSQPNNAVENALITQQQLAHLYYQQHRFTPLIQTLHQIQNGLDSIPNKEVEASWNFLMSRYDSAIHQPDNALTYVNRYLQCRDAIRKQRKVVSDLNIFDQLTMMQSRYDIVLLEKHNHEKSLYLWIASILIISFFIISLQFFFNLKKSKKHISSLLVLNKKIENQQSQLEQSLEELERRNLEKHRIMHVVAHDLRSPLSAIKALATLIEEEYENEEINRTSLALIKSVCTDSGELIKSLIEIEETKTVPLKLEPVEVNSLLLKTVNLLSVKAKEKHQQIRLSNCAERIFMKADANKMNRVINNVITNAIKFSPSGSDIDVSCHVSDNDVTIQVKDSGIGIPEKYHASLFDTFTEAKRPGTNGEKPFGLGLSICKQIIEKHEGKIWFESIENKGTTMFIQIAKEKNLLSQLVSN